MMRLIANICLILALALPVAAGAQQISLDQAVQQIKSRGDLRVLSAERVKRDNKVMYRIKVLKTSDGRVKYIWVDPGN